MPTTKSRQAPIHFGRRRKAAEPVTHELYIGRPNTGDYREYLASPGVDPLDRIPMHLRHPAKPPGQ